MEYEVYRHKDASDKDFNNIDQIFKRVLAEDKWLCNKTQENLNGQVYVNGQLHNRYEAGPLYFQSLVKKSVMDHRRKEQKRGAEIWPSAQNSAGFIQTTEEMAFCESLTCDPENSKALAW